MKAGVIGLGAMGAPMARYIHATGGLTAVGNRTQAKADALASELGVRAARSAANFADCDVVVLCVSLDADVLENVAALAEVLKPGAIVVDHSTVSVETARRAAATLGAHDIGFLDAPVSGGVEGARNGKLSIMVGGDAAQFERVQPIVASYAARITHMGGTGAGQATKAINQVLVAGINEAVCEGLALGEKLGLDADKLLPTLMAGAASNWFLDKRGATMLRDEFAPGFKCQHMLKDLRIVQGIARDTGIRTATLDQAAADYAELIERGYGEADTSALIALKRVRAQAESDAA
ncbi:MULTISPECIES: NAD(P)-dependent oxidoreductase [Lysobacter]|uniref:NAD(P)-dependent oxidoreductase n=1 Tax=Lysobacter yananisis TaxID=1003114 RepID=A0ABY9PDL9_9GAMM|nr:MULTISPECIES: NAD(P)-dependent oxidoreductase [Lysobacter]QCW24641.1 NAD(P)-dependent oxidoreductase [Lysobacter enzymogenes]QQQ01113.1 NAD(P)-dependent oxidoreductase [Lysobacter enzymogenes]WMT04271.1 NAD(P)-dependent oxidoreductase [Lysobacter yananisis]